MKKMQIKLRKIDDFLNLFAGLSKQRLELLWRIKELEPESVYQLAKSLKKSQPFILKEVQFLADKGLIDLKKVKTDGRTRVKPMVHYNLLSIDIQF